MSTKQKPKPNEDTSVDRVIEFESMSESELMEAQERLKAALTEKRERSRQECRDEIQKLLDSRGFTLDDVFPSIRRIANSRGPRSSQLAITHRNPHDPSQTWHGIGRRPEWMKALIDADPTLTPDSFRVSRSVEVADTSSPRESVVAN